MRITHCKGTAAASILLALVLGSRAQAQGLGEITLDSALNEPLRAHIELLDTQDLDASQIVVALASQSEFQVAGITNNFLLGSLRFKVIKSNNGTDRIEITSTQNISEPYLNFLLSVTWPNGRNLREYTLLLDLPTFNDNAAATTLNPAVGNNVQANNGQTTGSTATRAATAETGYVVQTGDTLYQIAEQTRPSSDVSVQQMMLAIQRANQDSFVNNNINRILTGKVLRIPANAEIALIDQAAAAAQVAAQNQELMSQPLAVNDSAGNRTVPVRDELTLLNGDQAAGAQTAGGSGDLDATIAALENELMVSEENVDRARLENLELTNRLAALQEQIDLLQNIIAIEDERIAQLQSELNTQSAATEQALTAADSAAQAADSTASGLVGMLKYGIGALVVLLGAALGYLLYMKRRRTEAKALDDGAVALTDIDTNEAVEKAGLAVMLAALLARFRRSKNDETAAEPIDELDDLEPQLAAPVVVAAPPPATPAVPPKPAQVETSELLSEMGLTDEFLDLDSVLDEVDNEVMLKSVPETAQIVDEPAAVAEVATALSEADLLKQALDDAELQEVVEAQTVDEHDDEDFLRAPVVTPAVPESFAFTSEPLGSESESDSVEVTVEAPAEETAAVFKFTLPEQDEPASVEVAQVEPEAKPLETFAFTAEPVSATAEPAAKDSDDSLELLSFDEDSIVIDEVPEEQGYTPAISTDTHDARLDLAVAYEAMGDLEGAIEILDEVIASGRATQVAEAERLKQKWQNG